MNFNSISNMSLTDRQLVLVGLNLKNIILTHKEFNPKKENDPFFSRILVLAKEFDKIFKDSLQPGKGA